MHIEKCLISSKSIIEHAISKYGLINEPNIKISCYFIHDYELFNVFEYSAQLVQPIISQCYSVEVAFKCGSGHA